INTFLLLQLMRAPTYSRSTEYADNRISLFSAQWGKCAVTGKKFQCISEIHCHHKKPKGIGGSDKYENLVLVLAPVHELIHAVDEDTIRSYLTALKLDTSQLTKLNKLRTLAKRKPIDLEKPNPARAFWPRHRRWQGRREIAIGKPLKLSPAFPPLHTGHATFTASGVPSIKQIS
ncbi:HNH endonuclease signature motif containing protein, partial [Pilosibacter fragilis]|uniref:HNH endonuclease signature motif containing protein n=1 Tax=Pilosibacter fragilis TaxID=3078042 RepID=UPI0032D3CE08